MKTLAMFLISMSLIAGSTGIAFSGPPEGITRLNQVITFKGEVTTIDYKAEKLIIKDEIGKMKVFHAYPGSIRDLNVGDFISVSYRPSTNHVMYAKIIK